MTLFVLEPEAKVFVLDWKAGDTMRVVARTPISEGATINFGINASKCLTDVLGNTVTISGSPAPSVTGINCTATYLSNANGIIAFSVTPTYGKRSRAQVQLSFSLSNGEAPKCVLDLDVV